MEFKRALFGLNVSSDLSLPGPEADFDKPDVTVRVGTCPEKLDQPTWTGPWFEVSPGRFLLSMDGAGRYLALDGKEITVQPAPDADPAEVNLFLLGSVFGVLLHQRHLLPMHGASIEIDGDAILICGSSGVGKSTTARELVSRGYRLLSDDVTVIADDEDGAPVAVPGYPQMKLWEDALLRAGDDPDALTRIRPEIRKYARPIDDSFCDRPRPVRAMFVLNASHVGDVTAEPLTGQQRLASVIGNTYRHRMLKALGVQEANFRLCHMLASRVPITAIQRDRRDQAATPDVIVDAILDNLNR